MADSFIYNVDSGKVSEEAGTPFQGGSISEDKDSKYMFLSLFQLVIPYNFILYAILSFYVNNAFFFQFMIWKIMWMVEKNTYG